MVKNEHTIRQMERMLDGSGISAKRSPLDTGKATTANNPYSFENVLES
jgi:hypothetical protein